MSDDGVKLALDATMEGMKALMIKPLVDTVEKAIDRISDCADIVKKHDPTSPAVEPVLVQIGKICDETVLEAEKAIQKYYAATGKKFTPKPPKGEHG